MVRNVVVGLQEVLKQYQDTNKTLPVISEPNKHEANSLKSIRDQLGAQPQYMQAMQMQYAATPQPIHQDYGGHGYYEGHKDFCGQVGRGAHR